MTPSPGPLRAALIDLDGTLVDTLGDFDEALARTLQDLGAARLPREFVERTIGKGSEHLIRRTLQAAGLAGDRYGDAWARYQHHYRTLNGDRARVFEGVPEGLHRLREAGWRLVCLTNKPGEFAQALLARMGLLDAFEAVYGGDAFERRKPDPLPLLKACERLDLPSEAVLMVGDSANDAQAARAAGCPIVLVRYGYNHGEPIDAVAADRHIDRLDEIDPCDPFNLRARA